jgi:hypothetical protein
LVWFHISVFWFGASYGEIRDDFTYFSTKYMQKKTYFAFE